MNQGVSLTHSPYPISFREKKKNGKKRVLCVFANKEDKKSASISARKDLYRKSDFQSNNNILQIFSETRNSQLILCFDIKNFYNSLAIEAKHPLLESSALDRVDLKAHLPSVEILNLGNNERIFTPLAGLPASPYIALRLLGAFQIKAGEKLLAELASIFHCAVNQIDFRNYSDNLFFFFKGEVPLYCDRKKLVEAEVVIDKALKEFQIGTLNKTKSYFIMRRKKGNRQSFMKLLGFRVVRDGGIALTKECESKLKKQYITFAGDLSDRVLNNSPEEKKKPLRERWLSFLGSEIEPFSEEFLARFEDEKKEFIKLHGKVKYYLEILLKSKMKLPGFLMRLYAELMLIHIFLFGSLKSKEKTFLKRLYRISKFPSLQAIKNYQTHTTQLLSYYGKNNLLLARYRTRLKGSLTALYLNALLKTQFFKIIFYDSEQPINFISVIKKSEALLEQINRNVPSDSQLKRAIFSGLKKIKVCNLSFVWRYYKILVYSDFPKEAKMYLEKIKRGDSEEDIKSHFINAIFSSTETEIIDFNNERNIKNTSRLIWSAANSIIPILSPLWKMLARECFFSSVSSIILARKTLSLLKTGNNISMLFKLIPLLKNHSGSGQIIKRVASLVSKRVIFHLEEDVKLLNYLIKNKKKYPLLLSYIYTKRFSTRVSFLDMVRRAEKIDISWQSPLAIVEKLDLRYYFFYRTLHLKKNMFRSNPHRFFKQHDNLVSQIKLGEDFKDLKIPKLFHIKNKYENRLLDFNHPITINHPSTIENKEKEKAVTLLFGNPTTQRSTPAELCMVYAKRLLMFSPHANQQKYLELVKEFIAQNIWPVALTLLFFRLSCDRRGKINKEYDILFGEFLLFCRVSYNLSKIEKNKPLNKKTFEILTHSIESCIDDIVTHPFYAVIADDSLGKSPYKTKMDKTIIDFDRAHHYINKCVASTQSYAVLTKRMKCKSDRRVVWSRVSFCPVELLMRGEIELDCSLIRTNYWLSSGIFATMLFYKDKFPEELKNYEGKSNLLGAAYLIVSPESPLYTAEYIFKTESGEGVRFIIVDKLQLTEYSSLSFIEQFFNSPLFSKFDYVFVSGRTLSNYRETNNAWHSFLKSNANIKRATFKRLIDKSSWSSYLNSFESTLVKLDNNVPLFCVQHPTLEKRSKLLLNRKEFIEIRY